jgi:cytochrome c oxidase cbb3-type subunit 3
MPDSTDPKELPGADPHTGERLVDPVSGYDTTGHDWGGITELNTAFPKLVIWALIVTHVYAVIAWILLPAWPLGDTYTKGLLKLDQGEQAIEGFRELVADRQDWLGRFETDDLGALGQDAALMALARPDAARLFADNCAACHGVAGQGGPGFPNLTDNTWLWSGTPEAIAETIRFGINSDHPDTRLAQMPAFDWMSRDERLALARFVADLPRGGADFDSPAGLSFAENCSACHGEAGEGGLETGAPSLADRAVIYGQGVDQVMTTLRHGRQGRMPAWEGRLTEAQVNLLALHVAGMSAPAPAPAPGGGQ